VLSEGLGLDASAKPRRSMGGRLLAPRAALLRRCTARPDKEPEASFPSSDERGERWGAAALTWRQSRSEAFEQRPASAAAERACRRHRTDTGKRAVEGLRCMNSRPNVRANAPGAACRLARLAYTDPRPVGQGGRPWRVAC